ncbi:hypothetical protein CONPUDRAFT_75336 [Coniophora puteana RWD-64-598 SS2]|uniref:Uncharacterized protein n=1 Tax=Coniophora puteana (strain RWD-64-598) TaxID=741705 RepID=A0A5M3MJF7_CONPW|nr:uncharacterized protein CONPUDRAFT_75336 [Coniophora puteana RWD-64-598 SS2]EIW78731.1 hypothetical protein CONPUDRAFT_75336 [Coniophora puteana RWD-64-598 SS2]
MYSSQPTVRKQNRLVKCSCRAFGCCRGPDGHTLQKHRTAKEHGECNEVEDAAKHQQVQEDGLAPARSEMLPVDHALEENEGDAYSEHGDEGAPLPSDTLYNWIPSDSAHASDDDSSMFSQTPLAADPGTDDERQVDIGGEGEDKDEGDEGNEEEEGEEGEGGNEDKEGNEDEEGEEDDKDEDELGNQNTGEDLDCKGSDPEDDHNGLEDADDSFEALGQALYTAMGEEFNFSNTEDLEVHHNRVPSIFDDHPIIRGIYIEAFISVAFHGSTHEAVNLSLKAHHRHLDGLRRQHPKLIFPGLDDWAFTFPTVLKCLGLSTTNFIMYLTVCDHCWTVRLPSTLNDLPYPHCPAEDCPGLIFQEK